MSKNIILCGFMGSGKTTIGHRLAVLLDRPFLDMDAYIEEQEGMTIKEIFAQKGEEAFRRMETEACRTLSKEKNLIIGSGGGTVLREENAALLRENGVILLLDVPLWVLQKRLQYDTHRPLLQKPNREEIIRNLYHQRTPLYRSAADYRVHTKKTALQTAEFIARKFGNL